MILKGLPEKAAFFVNENLHEGDPCVKAQPALGIFAEAVVI